jgi:DNA topoisomerase-2
MAGGRKSREEEEWQGESRSSEEENDGIGAGDRGAARRGGAAQRRALAERSNTPVEEVYQKKSQLEHILLRPDTYVGSTEKVPHTAHVPEDTGPDGETVMTQRQLTLSPGLYKIFDEVLVNAADNKVRDPKGMKELRVHIDQRRGSVSVFNDGRGIDVEVHREEGVHVPELIFGHLLTSSNYNDSERKVTGGRNGFGAKLANIFSTEFVVETADGSRKKQYKQVFNSNMQRKTEPTIKTCRASDNWTKITFTPDLQRFQMDHLEDGVVQLMSKRVYDIAGTIGKDTKVYLNDYKIPIKGFADYVDLFLKHKPDCPKIHERVNDRWEVCISASEGQQQNVSFVNSINTTRGGSHVTHIADQIATKMLEKMPKKDKVNLKPLHVKNNLFIFVNCLIENPAFDSQTKETLTTRQNAFGSKCEISDQIINKIMKSQIKDNVLSLASQKQSKARIALALLSLCKTAIFATLPHCLKRLYILSAGAQEE